MENNKINDLIEEGKKHLSELQAQIDKLAETAGKVAGAGAEEFTRKAEEIIKEAEVDIETAKTAVEAKTKEVMASPEFKNLETEGKKAVDEAQVKIAELAKQANAIADDFGDKLRNIFGKK
jgi:ElaB/YqjD/DUF883 family membrane-anchored ribosome-binding protein